MVKHTMSNTAGTTDKPATKHSQVIALLQQKQGTTLEEMSALTNWLPHSTRAFMAGLRKKGHVIESEKIEGVRRYRITSPAKA